MEIADIHPFFRANTYGNDVANKILKNRFGLGARGPGYTLVTVIWVIAITKRRSSSVY